MRSIKPNLAFVWAICGLLLTCPLYVWATPADSAFSQGVVAFETGEFTQAIMVWDLLLTREGESAKVLYNLGRAHYELGHTGESIWALEKALDLAPSNSDIQNLLHLAQQRVQDRFAPPPDFFLKRGWTYTRNLLLPSGWMWLGLGLHVLACAIFFFRNQIPDKRLLFSRIGGILALAGLLTYTLGISRQIHLSSDTYTVLLEASTPVRSAPDILAPTQFEVHAGIKVEQTDLLDDWIEIILPDGRKGWVEKEFWESI